MRERGFQLLDMVVVLAIIGLATAAGVPSALEMSRGLRVRLAAQELAMTLRRARSEAVRRNFNVGIKFSQLANGRVRFTLHRDGDGDGVLTRDIRSGTDPAIGASRELGHLGGRIRLGIPAGPPPPRDPGDPRRRLDRLDDPVRFNRSDIAAFSPIGVSTPGSLYVTDGYHLIVVRLFGRTGKVRLLRYDWKSETWE